MALALVGNLVLLSMMPPTAFAALEIVPTDTTIEHHETPAASTANQTALGSDPALLLLVLSGLAVAGVVIWLVSTRRPVGSTERGSLDP